MLAKYNDIEAFLNYIKTIPILTVEQEYELAVNYYERGCTQSAHKLVTSHLRYVAHVARKFKNYKVPLLDLIQEGTIGLMKAIAKYNPYRGGRLISFAINYIKSPMYDYVIRNSKIVISATTKSRRKLFFNIRKYLTNSNSLSSEQKQTISKELNVSVKDVEAMEYTIFSDVQGDNVLQESGDVTSLFDTFQADESYDPEVRVFEEHDRTNTLKQLYEAMDCLTPREREVLEARFLSEDPLPYNRFADKYNVSVQRIEQIQKSAISKLKREMELTMC